MTARPVPVMAPFILIYRPRKSQLEIRFGPKDVEGTGEAWGARATVRLNPSRVQFGPLVWKTQENGL